MEDEVDGKLLSSCLNRDGNAFTAARYDEYLAWWEASFASPADDEPIDDVALGSAVEAQLDRLYGDWVAAGRPPAAAEEPLSIEAATELPEAEEAAWRAYEAAPEPDEHVSPATEALIPRDLTDPPPETISVTAVEWGSSQLKRALRRLGADPRQAIVARALGSTSNDVLSVTVYRVAGVDAARLTDEFESVIPRKSKGAWKRMRLGSVEIHRAASEEFTTVWWATDDLVFEVAGDPRDMVGTVLRLTEPDPEPGGP